MEQELEITVGAMLFGDDPVNDDDLSTSLGAVSFTGTQPAQVDYALSAPGFADSKLNEATEAFPARAKSSPRRKRPTT